jgi:Tol biopolymer transport system component
MATGKRAFEGASRASLIASIMSSQPRPISELKPLTPPALDRLVRKCLAKDPDARWQSASDVADELRWIAATGTVASQARVAARPGRLMWLAWALATLLVAGLAVRLVPRSAQKAVEVRTIRLSLLPSGPLDLDPEPANVAISPDGTQIVFAASEPQGTKRLWLRPLTSQTTQPLQGTESGDTPFWSPDSRFIAFFAGGKLKKVAATGGAPQVLCDAPDGRGGTWNRDDVILFAPGSGSILQRVSAGGGLPTPVTQLDAARGENAHRFPCFLPDGKHFLYVTLPSQGREYPVRLGSLEGGKPVDLMKAWGAPAYAPPGILVFPQRSAVMLQRFDAERLALVGEPVPIPEVSNRTTYRSGANTVSVSSNGVLVSAPGLAPPTKVVWFDREGRQEAQIPLPEACYQNPAISPDGGSVAIMRVSAEADDLLRIDLTRGVATRLTFGDHSNNNPRWSPDGRWIVFTSNRGPSRDLYRIAGTGGDQEELIVKLEGNFNNPLDWSRDGRFIIYRSLSPQTNEDLWLVSMTEEPKPVPFLKTPFNEGDGSFAPDGRWVAYHSDESGRNELYVQSFPIPGSKTQISTEGANERYLLTRDNASVWWRRADEILYLSADSSTMMAVAVETGESVKAGASRSLFKLPAGTTEITAAPDGQRFLVIMGVAGRAQSAPTVVVNWDAGLLKP